MQDTALGVSEYDLLRIFEPLYRADVARGRSTGSSGLGLAICEQIVIAHQGVIRAEASALGGVLFHLELPRFGDETTLPTSLRNVFWSLKTTARYLICFKTIFVPVAMRPR